MCNIDKSQLILYLYDELDSETKSSFEKHLQDCQDCQTEINDYRKILDKLSKMPMMEPSNIVPAKPQRSPDYFGVLPRYRRRKTFSLIAYGAIAASFVLLTVITYLKLPTTNVSIPPAPKTDTVVSIPIPEDTEICKWDNGLSDEIDALKESANTIALAMKTPPLVSLDESIGKIENNISRIIHPDNFGVNNDR